MKLKCLTLSNLEQVRQWRNKQLESLRTPFLLTKEHQEKFYHDVICNRQANARFWGIWEAVNKDVKYEDYITSNGAVSFARKDLPGYPVIENNDGRFGYGTEELKKAVDKLKKQDVFIGMCGLESISWENRLAEVSLLLNPDYPMDKYGKEALHLLLHEGFMNMSLENIYTETYYCNPNLLFWEAMNIKFNPTIKGESDMIVLPNRKYHNGKYWNSLYINISKGAFMTHENLISQPA